MLLAVNIGNSNIRFGVKKGENIIESWTIGNKPYKTREILAILFRQMYTLHRYDISDFRGIVIGSVVPHQTEIVSSILEEIHKISPIIVDRNTKSNVTQHSPQIGTDLYANAVAAHNLYQGDKIIVDFGTALTLTGVGKDGEVKGVIIGAGVITSLNSLIGNTAQLTDIELIPPKNVLGKDTISCMQSGMIYGYVAMVEGLIDKINKEMKSKCKVISTGGLGHIYKPLSPSIHIDDKLHTIKGLCYLYEYALEN